MASSISVEIRDMCHCRCTSGSSVFETSPQVSSLYIVFLYFIIVGEKSVESMHPNSFSLYCIKYWYHQLMCMLRMYVVIQNNRRWFGFEQLNGTQGEEIHANESKRNAKKLTF